MLRIKCNTCGKDFESKRNDARYCSAKCRVTANRAVEADAVHNQKVDKHPTIVPNKPDSEKTAGELVREAVADGPRCSSQGCLCKAVAEGLCQRHYDELLKERELERRKKPTSA